MLSNNSPQRSRVDPASASHDEEIIEQALLHVRGQGIGGDQFEFQMLFGIGRDVRRRLIGEGYRLRCPFGSATHDIRRL